MILHGLKISHIYQEAIKEQQTIEFLSKKYELHPTQINTWKKEFLAKASLVFEKDTPEQDTDQEKLIESLYAKIGNLSMVNDFLKKKLL